MQQGQKPSIRTGYQKRPDTIDCPTLCLSRFSLAPEFQGRDERWQVVSKFWLPMRGRVSIRRAPSLQGGYGRPAFSLIQENGLGFGLAASFTIRAGLKEGRDPVPANQ